jgi:Glyoxalase/Bleomycin resistance protein/Dioxygenase superfamily.
MRKYTFYALLLTIINGAYASNNLEDDVPCSHAKAHVALPVEDIQTAKNFYASVFNVVPKAGKSPADEPVYALEIGPMVIAFNQVRKVAMSPVNTILAEDLAALKAVKDTYFVPCQHVGFFHLAPKEFEDIILRAKHQRARFIMEPTIINPQTRHEQWLAFFTDPQGYVLEIRASSVQRGFQPTEFEQQSGHNIKITKP